MEQRGHLEGFGPVHGKRANALILGSYPSPKSFAQGFYYGHPQNRFWPLMAQLTEKPVPTSLNAKTTLITGSGLALWDVLKQCSITGASDSSIVKPVPNNIASLVQTLGIQAIFCNGAAAHRFYRQCCQNSTGLTAILLPSTSPANAAYSLARLKECWQPLVSYLSMP